MSGQTKRFGKKRIQEMGGCEGAQFTFTDFGRVAPKDPSGQTPKKQLANFSRGRHFGLMAIIFSSNQTMKNR